MNYAIVYLAGILFFSMVYWFLQGRKFYTGPLIEAEVDIGVDGERSSEEVVEKKNKNEDGVLQSV